MRSPQLPILKTRDEIDQMARLGALMPRFWAFAEEQIKPGVTDREIEAALRDWWGGGLWLSLSIGSVVAHGGARGAVLREGDLMTVDAAVRRGEWWMDSARTFGVEPLSREGSALLEAGRRSLERAKEKVQPGTPFSEMGEAVSRLVEESGYYLWEDGLSHGIGRQLHEPPQIAMKWGQKEPGWFVPGMTLALEPVLLSARADVQRQGDEYVTAPDVVSVHFEDTLAVLSEGVRGLSY